MPYIYFIHEEGSDNCFKMGKTENHPIDRANQLQTGNPRKLLVYRFVEIGDHSTAELYLHCKYQDFHVRGEWYNISRSVVDEECDIISSNDITAKTSGAYEYASKEEREVIKATKPRRRQRIAPMKQLLGKMEKLGGFSDE